MLMNGQVRVRDVEEDDNPAMAEEPDVAYGKSCKYLYDYSFFKLSTILKNAEIIYYIRQME